MPRVEIRLVSGMVCLQGHEDALLFIVELIKPDGHKEILYDELICVKCQKEGG